jgi:hypothetical protein
MDHIVRKVIEIELHPNKINRDAGFCLSKSWKPLICSLKKSSWLQIPAMQPYNWEHLLWGYCICPLWAVLNPCRPTPTSSTDFWFGLPTAHLPLPKLSFSAYSCYFFYPVEMETTIPPKRRFIMNPQRHILKDSIPSLLRNPQILQIKPFQL